MFKGLVGCVNSLLRYWYTATTIVYTSGFAHLVNEFTIQCSGVYMNCVYDGVWWLALVMETYPSSKEAKLKFLHPKGPSPSFKFPKTDDVLIVGCMDILMKANPTRDNI